MKGYQDSESKDIKNKLLLGIFFVIVFGSLLLVLIYRKFIFGTQVTRNRLLNKSFVVFVDGDNCNNCTNIKNFLSNKNVEYEIVLENNDDAIEMFKDYGIIYDKSISPAVIYIKKGKMEANLVNITNTEELDLFIDNYGLSK